MRLGYWLGAAACLLVACSDTYVTNNYGAEGGAEEDGGVGSGDQDANGLAPSESDTGAPDDGLDAATAGDFDAASAIIDSGVDSAPPPPPPPPPDSGPPDSGPPPVTVLWSNTSVESRPAWLGGIATQAYHRAQLQFTIDRVGLTCFVRLRTPMRATGWTGHTDFSLTSSELACFRDVATGCNTPKVHLQWLSCGAAEGCSTFVSGNVREVQRPACDANINLSGGFFVRHTVRALGPGGVDETWALVAQ